MGMGAAIDEQVISPQRGPQFQYLVLPPPLTLKKGTVLGTCDFVIELYADFHESKRCGDSNQLLTVIPT